jgi:hypothetical protein
MMVKRIKWKTKRATEKKNLKSVKKKLLNLKIISPSDSLLFLTLLGAFCDVSGAN